MTPLTKGFAVRINTYVRFKEHNKKPLKTASTLNNRTIK